MDHPAARRLHTLLDPTTIRGALLLGTIAAVIGGTLVLAAPWLWHHLNIHITWT
jgi:hypothetical protein